MGGHGPTGHPRGRLQGRRGPGRQKCHQETARVPRQLEGSPRKWGDWLWETTGDGGWDQCGSPGGPLSPRLGELCWLSGQHPQGSGVGSACSPLAGSGHCHSDPGPRVRPARPRARSGLHPPSLLPCPPPRDSSQVALALPPGSHPLAKAPSLPLCTWARGTGGPPSCMWASFQPALPEEASVDSILPCPVTSCPPRIP